MKDVVLITGGNGLVAKYFGKMFSSKYSIRYLTRNVTSENQYVWCTTSNYIDKQAFEGVKHIIHLAGAGIAARRWTKNRKFQLLSSRVDSANLILEYLKNNNIKINTFISASAVGYYGSETTNVIHIENEEAANDFLGNLCKKWESVANQFSKYDVACRTVILRLGVILSKRGGAFSKMLLPIKYCIGSPIGSGNQYFPWIHIDDVVNIIDYSISNTNMFGVFNTVAPDHLTNKDFTKKLAQILNKPLFLPNIPEFLFKILFGEMSIILTKGSRISADKIMSYGYEFKYPTIDLALKTLVGKE